MTRESVDLDGIELPAIVNRQRGRSGETLSALWRQQR
jgi:hypothetical protein